MEGPLGGAGFVRMPGPFADRDAAWSSAWAILEEAGVESSLAVIGDFVIPPADGPPSRDFQTLHVDFGVPLVPVAPADVARFTALYIGPDSARSEAVTRLVPIAPLLAQLPWPDRDELIRRFTDYGGSHGARDDAAGYVEGSFARMIEAATGRQPVLPSVKEHLGFLCGTEFTTLAEEVEFFARRNLPLETVEIGVCLRPGELLVFDNIALAHGRRGARRPGELDQRVFGHAALAVEEQLKLRERLLAAFRAEVASAA